ncbi:MAG: PDZ domain-containing protein [Akkermansia sp.]
MIRSLLLALMVLCFASCAQKPIVHQGPNPIETHSPIVGVPTIQAWCDDEPLLMGVDTGAVQSALFFSPTVKNLGGRLYGKKPMQTTNLQVSLNQQEETLSPRTDVAIVSSAPYDGLIGWQTIRRFVWHLNLPKQTHAFYNELPKQVKKWNKLSLVKQSDYVQIKDLSNRQIILDTGAPYAVYISRAKWEHFKLDYPDAFVSIYSGYSPAAGGYYAYECMHIKSMQLGSLTLKNIIVCESFVDKNILNIAKDIDLMLGMGALSDREFWLDGPGNTLYFGNTTNRSHETPTYNLVGATFIPDKESPHQLKARVATWSPAWEAGLRNNDILVSINGRIRPNDSDIEFITMLAGAHATVVVHRGKHQITIKWVVPEQPEAGEYHPTPIAITPEAYEQLQREEQLKEQLDTQAKTALQQAIESSSHPTTSTSISTPPSTQHATPNTPPTEQELTD